MEGEVQQQGMAWRGAEGSRPSTPDSDDSDDSFHTTSGEDPTVPLAWPAEEAEGQHVIEPDDSPCFTPEPEPLQEDKEHQEEEEEAKDIKDEEEEEAKDKKEQEDEEDEEFFVDEELLKDRELNMTEEERIVWRDQSLQHKENGNVSFKKGDLEPALREYTAGLRVCPLSCSKDRAVLYSNRAAARAKLNMKKEAIQDCTRAIDLDECYTKAILRRATLSRETDQLDDALRDFSRVLELEPSNRDAQEAVRTLPDMITERNEKLKEEMMGKLKDLGNMFLQPFGLSTSNFEVNQDPNSGGYNISFNQNAKST